MSWSLAQGAAYVASITERAQAAGWMVGMYGSTVTLSAGRDLDLMFVPWRPGATFSCWDLLGAIEVSRNVSAWSDGSMGVLGLLPNGEHVDALVLARGPRLDRLPPGDPGPIVHVRL